MGLSLPGTHLTAESTEAMRIKCLAQGNNILLPGFEPSTSVSRNRHYNHCDQYAMRGKRCITCLVVDECYLCVLKVDIYHTSISVFT